MLSNKALFQYNPKNWEHWSIDWTIHFRIRNQLARFLWIVFQMAGF